MDCYFVFELDKQINVDQVVIGDKSHGIVHTQLNDVHIAKDEYQAILKFEDKSRKSREFFLQIIISFSISYSFEIFVNWKFEMVHYIWFDGWESFQFW